VFFCCRREAGEASALALPYIFHSVTTAQDGLMSGFNLFPPFLSGE
jgi:hypothetical protein